MLSAKPAVADAGTRSVPGTALPVIATGVRATWEDHDLLGPFTLPTLEPGTRVRVKGDNGMGKSTLLAVLARQLDPVSGRHQLNGVPASHVHLEEARAAVAVVDDEPHASAGTVRANVRLANPQASDDDIQAALAAADLQRWLEGSRRVWTRPCAVSAAASHRQGQPGRVGVG
ncbi:MAG: ATP-binding cassette domain-containing protein [Ornithinimicrobium sp.]